MSDTGILALLLIAANILISWRGFTNASFYEQYKFEVDKILVYKEYWRLVSSGFLHVGWVHLLFNMFSLFAFSGPVLGTLGSINFLLVYFSSLIGGNLLSLFIHRHHGDYSAVGASGAVCGIIFSSIALYPGVGIGFLGIPIPGLLYALLYVLYSVYGIRSKKDNIGHDAHLGGAIIGLAVAVLLHPSSLAENYITIFLIFVPSIAFIWFIINRPHLLLVDNLFFKNHRKFYTADHLYNVEKANQQQELDRILDKINHGGMGSLSKKEKMKLKEYSK